MTVDPAAKSATK